MKKIKKENIGEILQRLYDSEIDIAIGWLYDGGFVFAIENNPYPLETKYKKENIILSLEDRIEKAMPFLVKEILKKFPKSAFTE